MPAFNRVDTIARAVNSVLAQDFGDFELIVVDDGSSDGTPEAVAAIGDPRIRLIRLGTNGGGNAARNRGIREARALLVAFLDSDDHYLPEKLGAVTQFFAARPDIEVWIDSFLKVYPASDKRPPRPRPNPVLEDNDALLTALFTRRIYKATPGISCRREAALRAGLFDETLKRRQDFDFILRLAKVARIASTDRILWVKTNSPDAISADDSTFLDAILEFVDRHPAYLADPRFRPGLAIDLARYFNRLVARRRFAMVGPAIARLTSRLGARRLATLLIGGYVRLLGRMRN